MDSSKDSFKSASFDGLDQQQGKTTLESGDVLGSMNNNEFEEEEYRRQTRKRLIIIAISAVILVLLIIGLIVGIFVPMHTKNHSSVFVKDKDTLKTICNSTLYQDSCYSSIYSLKMSSGKNNGSDPDSMKEIFMLSLQVTLNELVRLKSSIFRKKDKHDSITQNAFDVCDHLIQDAIGHANMSISSLQHNELSAYDVSDIRTWISTSITDQQTCLEGLMEFENISLSLQEEIKASMQNATEFTSNSLAIISNMFSIIQGPVQRKLFQVQQNHFNFIGWKHRRLLEAKMLNFRPNLTVAKDGSGDYQTISDAVKLVPKRSSQRFVIYVKEGEYKENVLVGSDSWNLMIYGDGMKTTIVSGSLNYADGVAPYNSGTFSKFSSDIIHKLFIVPHKIIVIRFLKRAVAEGRGFIARDIGFKNKAGPEKLQAVALRSSSDKSIFYRCYFDGYQDTLYTHANRQYYRDCIITGTVDFIFGNAAVVFQSCDLRPRQPGPGQYNVITAQSKSDPNQNTGFSIQESKIIPLGNFSARTYLGRPWNNYSTTVVMKTDIQGFIDPAGWITWVPDREAPDKIFYAEYKNTGPGSALDQRITWPGYRRNITEEEAERFSVEQFFQGEQWISEANVEFNLSL